MINQIYPPELHKAYTSYIEVPFWIITYLFLTCDKHDDFNFDIIVNIPFFDDALYPFYGVYISELIIFARVCSDADDLNARNKRLTATLLKQVIGIMSLEDFFKAISPTP